MADVDKRRFDERVPVNSEPFWFTSAIIDTSDAGDIDVLKSFSAIDGTYQILAAGVEVIEAFDGAASFIFGTGTMATKLLGAVTAVDADYFSVSADITEATIGYYPAIGTVGGFGAAMGAGTATIIKGTDAVVPVFYGTITATAPTTGKARLHVLMTKIPLA